ncbi:MAG TPA: YncE family protein [Spirochaetes bacterium]|nr:YncE family protein [Spirochaetota bacterium]
MTKNPWGFTRLGNSNLVAVSSWNKGITIIDFTKHKIVKEKRYTYNLGGIVSTADGQSIFVVATKINKVFKVNAKSLDIVDEYQTGKAPDGIGISWNDSKLYVTNTKDATISVINLKDKSDKIIKTGGKPELIHSNHSRTKLYISNFKKNLVHILDTKTDRIIKEISGLNGTEEAVLSQSEKTLYVVNFKTSKIFAYNAITHKKQEREFSVGKKPIGVVSALNDTKLYVTNYGDNSLTVIKLPENTGHR